MTQDNLPERSIEEIVADARAWCSIADEICHRGGPVSYIELEFDVASSAAKSSPQTYWDSSIAPSINRAEDEAAKYGHRSDVVQALIKGYQELIATCKESTYYCYAKSWFDQRIGAHTERMQELKKILKPKK